MIRINNTDNKVTYRYMDIFEIIDQYHIIVSYNDDADNMLGPLKDVVQ
jgi:hypothetical protein